MNERRSDDRSPRSLVLLATLAALLLQVGWASAPEEVITRQAIIRQLTGPMDGVKGLLMVDAPAPGEAPQPAEGPSIDLPSITFALDSSELTAAARAQLDELGAALASAELRALRFQIVGHTDARGSGSYNQALSRRRAAAVRDYLIRFGRVAPQRLEAIGRGADDPSRPEDPWSAENRRVEIRNLGAHR